MLLKIEMAMVCAVLTIALCTSLCADEIQMKNGDRITGKIETMENKNLTVNTSYAGKIVIQWAQVEYVETDSAVHVVLEDETAADGFLKTTNAGYLQLVANDVIEPLRFVVGQVKGINPPSVPSVQVSGRINTGLDIRKGNTDTEAYHFDGELGVRTKRNRHTVGAEMNREEESAKKTSDNWRLYMNYDHFLTKKEFFFANASFEQDDIRDLTLRKTVGGGSGYQFFESELINFSVRGGLAYVNSDYSVDDQDNDYTAGQWTIEYDQYFFDKFFQFFHLHEGIISVEDTKDMVIRTRTGLRIPLRKGFITTLQYNWDWDNAPAPGNDRVDERYLLTLGYIWE